MWSRELLAETRITPSNLIAPIFIGDHHGTPRAIPTLPDVYIYSITGAIEQAQRAYEIGLPAVILFPHIEPNTKKDETSEVLNPDSVIYRAIRHIKEKLPKLGVIADVALDPYTPHGHDGLWNHTKNDVDNDRTLEVLCKQALLLAEAGCDAVAPSDMMDGRVHSIRRALEQSGHHNTQIFSYAAKYASSFYGPFRHAVGSQSLLIGNKKSYQMSYHNSVEAELEAMLDFHESADVLIVKPAGYYLDIVQRISNVIPLPILAYQVSGEYAMLKYAAQNQVLNFLNALAESVICCKRAGARAIITYGAMELAQFLVQNYQY